MKTNSILNKANFRKYFSNIDVNNYVFSSILIIINTYYIKSEYNSLIIYIQGVIKTNYFMTQINICIYFNKFLFLGKYLITNLPTSNCDFYHFKN